MFPSDYTGPKRLDLDVIGARALVSPQHDLLLTGEVLGPINSAQPAIYSFLINRGGAKFPGLIPGRPMITYDSVVTVTSGPGKITGAVSLLDSKGQATSTTSLPSTAVRLNGNEINVTVPETLLPTTSPGTTHTAGAHPMFGFEAAVPGGRPSDVAGFAPEFTTIPIGRIGSTRH